MDDITVFKEQLITNSKIVKIGLVTFGIIVLIMLGIIVGLYSHQSNIQNQVLELQKLSNLQHELSASSHASVKGEVDDLFEVSRYCDIDYILCHKIQHNVENITRMDNKTIIYAYLESLEPQIARDVYWAILEPTHSHKRTISHYSSSISSDLDPPNGWGLLFWTINSNIHYGVTYCQPSPDNADPHGPSIICGAFTLKNYTIN